MVLLADEEMSRRDQSSLLDLCMQDCKSLCVVVMIYVIPINIYTSTTVASLYDKLS